MPIKESIDQLGFFGGKPASTDYLHVGRPNIGDRKRLLERFNDMLDCRWLTNDGPYVQELELRLADILGVKHCMAICNGTIALELAIRALELKGEVIVPSFTFIATAHALQWQEITPVFCDIDPVTHNIDPVRIEQLITPRTSGIIGVHVWGRACDIDALTEISEKHQLKLIFDAAHAFGCSAQGRMIGNFGEAEVFSFHATKYFNTFEGGMIATNCDDLATKIRLMRNFGFVGYDDVIYIGTNGKMSEASAIMGLNSIEGMEKFLEINYRNYQLYQNELADIPGIQLITFDEREKNNFQYIVVDIDEQMTGVSRDLIVEILHRENVLARRYFYPGCHQMEPYRSYFPHAGLLLPETEKLVHRLMVLPTGMVIGPDEVQLISEIIRFTVAHGPRITQRASSL